MMAHGMKVPNNKVTLTEAEGDQWEQVTAWYAKLCRERGWELAPDPLRAMLHIGLRCMHGEVLPSQGDKSRRH